MTPPIFSFTRVPGIPVKRFFLFLLTALVVIVFAIRARRNRAWWRAMDAEWERLRAIQEATDETRWQS